MTEIAKFHTDVFAALGSESKVSRNDIIASGLQWWIDAYWEDKEGRPTNKQEWAEKVKRHVEKRKRMGEKP